jgi:hypothetical protein
MIVEGRLFLNKSIWLFLLISFTKEPSSFEEAINCENKDDQNAWKEEIEKELNKMTKRGVWEIIDEKDVPND